MVEELARWKASLIQKNQLLLESNKQMLETISQVRNMQMESLKNLKFLGQLKSLNLPSSNVLDVTAECLNISQQLILHSGIGMPSSLDLVGLDSTTNAEKLAVQVITIIIFIYKLLFVTSIKLALVGWLVWVT